MREPRRTARRARTYRTVPTPKGPGTRAGVQYEHRVVAEAALGRTLRPDEQVRFTSEPPASRPVRPADIHVVTTSPTGPRFRAGVDDWEERIACGCNCGATRYRWDASGRERRYLPGHQGVNKPAPAQAEILAALERLGPSRFGDVARATTRTLQVVTVLLSRMARRGLVKRDERLWSIVDTATEAS